MFAQERMMDIKKEKEAFEAWFESQYDAHFMQFALDLDFYVDKHTQTCWEAWQAKAQAVPEGFVLVDKHQLAQLMANMDSFGKKALGDDYVSFADIAAVLDEAQEPTND